MHPRPHDEHPKTARFRRRACAVLAALALPSAAMAHKDDYLGDTFVFGTLDAREVEAEYWIDWRSDPRGLLHTAGLEYGLTNRLMLDFSARYAQPVSGAAQWETEFAELRYRFGDEGDRPIDVAASIEFAHERSGATSHRSLEPRLVLNHDVRGWNMTLNLTENLVLDDRARSALEASAGIRSPGFGAWNFGIELQRERALENATIVLPQTWLRIGEDTFLKAGVGYDLAAEHDHFVRVAIETEL